MCQQFYSLHTQSGALLDNHSSLCFPTTSSMTARELSPSHVDPSSSTGQLNTNKAGADPPLVRKYSPEDIECLVHQTSLCRICRVILGPQQDWVPIPPGQDWYYRHHESFNSLRGSVQAGCRLCLELQADRELYIRVADDLPISEWSSTFYFDASQAWKYPRIEFNILYGRVTYRTFNVLLYDCKHSALLFCLLSSRKAY